MRDIKPVRRAWLILCGHLGLVFLAAHAVAGEPDSLMEYQAHCSGCHGSDMAGRSGPALIGDAFGQRWSGHAAALERLISSSMPLDAPGSLSSGQYEAIGALLLSRNAADGGKSNGHSLPAQSEVQSDSRPQELPSAPEVFGPASSSSPDDAELTSPRDSDWLHYNRDLKGQRFTRLIEINKGNVGRVIPKCIFQTGELGSFQASPVVLDGRMYVTTAHRVYAIDAANCHRLWMYESQGGTGLPNNRGVALYKGMVIRGTVDGHLIALDMADGKLLWRVWACDNRSGCFITAAPAVSKGRIFIGTAGADFGNPGRVFAFDAATGRSLWSFDVVKPVKGFPLDPGLGGGSMWSTITVDAEADQLYVSVGNPGSDLDGRKRPGENLYTDSVVVLDAASGRLLWYVQQNPHDLHDWDTAAAPVLYEQHGRKLMAVGSKDARLYLYDRGTHRLLARRDLAPRSNDTLPITAAGLHVCPGILGGVEWNGPAFDPAAQLIFVNSVDWCVTLNSGDGKLDVPTLGGGVKWDSVGEARGSVQAFDAGTGDPRWVFEAGSPMLAGVTPTGSGLLMTGSAAGDFLILDSATGEKLYGFYTGGPVVGGISVYQVAGRQLIAVPSGNESKSFWQSAGAPTIVVFGLP